MREFYSDAVPAGPEGMDQVDAVDQVDPAARAPARDPVMKLAWWLLCVGCFFACWNLLRLGDINFTLTDFALLSSLVLVTLRGKLRQSPFGPLTVYWIAAVGCLLGGLMLSTLINGDPLRAVNVISQYAVAYLALAFLFMSVPREQARRLPLFFVVGVTLSQIVGILASQLLTFDALPDFFGNGFITGNGRIGAMAGEPNPNGASVAFAMPMLIYCMHRRLIRPLLGVPAFFLLGWGLILSASFTGFSSTCIALVITLALFNWRWLAIAGVAATVAIGLFVASGAPLPATFQERVGNAIETGEIDQAGTFVNRAELIEEAWHLAEHNAIIGMGVDEYRVISAHDNPVHNLYLLIWNEGGALAIGGLAAMLVLLLAMSFGAWPTMRAEGAVAGAVVVVFLIYTVSYPHMYSRQWIAPVMLVLSLIHARAANVWPSQFESIGPRPLPA
ncbi:O-antigen ligase family protein [Aurantiacibacter spongiae]|uniref:O-antigen ligase domain-containing protein n=1 Tax=Aurantiacibacter spongiae TaxID=2488860 RepID=A0A3N5CX02_9SPHN|nr:O-antigen ligase family protein [Aurantiacibacter spongiae]RPF71179.1 O-antigen ligase domain-containing protein [Aurantiacibacter spongiae]